MYVYETKKYKEAWAAFAMIKTGIINEPFSIEWLQDRPDLQIKQIGIEVTDAIESLEGEQRHFQNELTRCSTFKEACTLNNSNQSRNSKLKVKPLGKTDLPFIYRSSLVAENPSAINSTNLIIKKIKEKNDKYTKYPNSKYFRRKGLFIQKTDDVFLETPMITGEVLYTLDTNKINVTIQESIFDFVVLYLPKKLKLFSKNNIQVTNFDLTNEDIHDISLHTLSEIAPDEYQQVINVLRNTDAN